MALVERKTLNGDEESIKTIEGILENIEHTHIAYCGITEKETNEQNGSYLYINDIGKGLERVVAFPRLFTQEEQDALLQQRIIYTHTRTLQTNDEKIVKQEWKYHLQVVNEPQRRDYLIVQSS